MGRRNRRNSFSGKTDEEARKAQDQWARQLAKACNIKGDDAGRFRGVANVGRLETNADVSCARWTPAGRVRCRGKVERRLADCVLIKTSTGTSWQFASDCHASSTSADDGSIALCRGGEDLGKAGLWEAKAARWRRTVLINGCEVHALEDAADDDDGCDGLRTLWPAALACARLLEDGVVDVQNKAIIELGGGCCVPAVAAAILGAASVVATEMQASMAQLGENLLANGQTRISARCLDWREPLPADLIGDLILACDCTYNASLHEPLLQTLVALFARQRHAKALIVSDEASTPNAARTLAKFQKACVENGLVIGEIPDGAWRRRSPQTIRAFMVVPQPPPSPKSALIPPGSPPRATKKHVSWADGGGGASKKTGRRRKKGGK